MIGHRLWACTSLFFKLMRVWGQLLYGAWKVSSLPQPIVSIFGGSRLPQDNVYATQAVQIGRWLIEHDISVLTGGGRGIMEAVSYGALHNNGGKGRSMGIGVKDLGENVRNPYVKEYFMLDYFFARKWLLTRYSVAFIVFPGGFGTLDELSEVLTLILTGKMKRVPIVLIGEEYWRPFMQWVTQEALKHGAVAQEHIKLFTLTDDLYQAFCLVRDECKMPK
ncbi:MAG: TIGR00730 family Rossman fold protein [Candidatus Babeliales bacterium]